MSERFENILLGILLIIIGIIFIVGIYILIDFKNDYDCSTTNDINWYIEHNCMRYERRKK